MIRKLLLPALLTGLLGGCVTDYAYRYGGDGGDYYYGQPGVDYHYYDDGYGYYPYSYYPYSYYPYGGHYPYYRYGYPYPYYGNYGYPYNHPDYYYHHHRPPVVNPGPGTDPGNHGPRDAARRDDFRRPPRHSLDGRTYQPQVIVPTTPSQPQSAPRPPIRETPRYEPRRESGSTMPQSIHRLTQPKRGDSAPTHEP